MYPSSSASSSSSSQPHNSSIAQTGLTRYGSAPGSLLTSTVDAIIAAGGSRLPPSGHYFSGECKDHHRSSSSSYEAFDGSSALVRQKSSPAGFLAHLADHNHNAGFTITTHGGGGGGGQECLSRISENPATTPAAHTHSYGSSGGGGSGGWGENSNSIAFSAAKRSRTNNDTTDILHCLSALESQFSMPQTTLEMATVDHLLHIPEDSVPCKIRAKRGMATHPRSIAERERRTRISGKLKKLQDLVPNMDKQTSYADMLDLAVQHIKGLQGQVQKLHKELENCTCGCQDST